MSNNRLRIIFIAQLVIVCAVFFVIDVRMYGLDFFGIAATGCLLAFWLWVWVTRIRA